MSTATELDRILRDSGFILIPRNFKGVCISDLHLGVKGPADDFAKNEDVFNRAFDGYITRGFQPFLLGDITDLWENSTEAEIWEAYQSVQRRLEGCPRVKGNHDGELDLPEAFILRYDGTDKRIMLIHGHQGDFFCSAASAWGKFFVRHVWKNLQYVGMKDPTTATDANPGKHERVRQEIMKWSTENRVTVIFGHTHFAESIPPYYYNCGSWVGKGGQCVEIVGEKISVKSFTERG